LTPWTAATCSALSLPCVSRRSARVSCMRRTTASRAHCDGWRTARHAARRAAHRPRELGAHVQNLTSARGTVAIACDLTSATGRPAGRSPVPAQMWAQWASPVPAQMWEGRAQSWPRCGQWSQCRCGQWASPVRAWFPTHSAAACGTILRTSDETA
jgi:hypothetical protein